MKLPCFLFSLPVDLLNIVLHSETHVCTQVLRFYLSGGGGGIFPAVLEGEPKFLHKSERAEEYHNSHEYHKSDEKPWTFLQREKGKGTVE